MNQPRYIFLVSLLCACSHQLNNANLGADAQVDTGDAEPDGPAPLTCDRAAYCNRHACLLNSGVCACEPGFAGDGRSCEAVAEGAPLGFRLLATQDSVANAHYSLALDEDGSDAALGEFQNGISLAELGSVSVLRLAEAPAQVLLPMPARANRDTSFGAVVAIDGQGNTIVAGSGSDSEISVYQRGDGEWVRSSYVLEDTVENDPAPRALALSADATLLVVGMSRASGGFGRVATLVRQSSGTYVREPQTISRPEGCSEFGYALGLARNGSYLAISCNPRGPSAGRSFVYARRADGWALTTEITPNDGAVEAPGIRRTGGGIALDADGATLVFTDVDHGLVYVCTRTGDQWSTPKLLAQPWVRRSNGELAYIPRLNRRVQISDDGLLLIVSAALIENGLIQVDSAFPHGLRAYRRTSRSADWSNFQTIVSPTQTRVAEANFALSGNGNRLVVTGINSSSAPTTLMFTRD